MSKSELAKIARERIQKLEENKSYYPMNTDDVLMFIEHYGLKWQDIDTDLTMDDFRVLLNSKIKQHFKNQPKVIQDTIGKVNTMFERAAQANLT